MKRIRKSLAEYALAVLLVLYTGASAQAAPEVLNVIAQGDTLFMAGSGVVIKYDLLSGRFDVVRGQGEIIASHAHSEAVVTAAVASPQTLTLAGDTRLSWYKEDISDALGKGRRVIITRRLQNPKAELVNILTTYENAAGVLVALKVINRSGRGLLVESLRPFVAEPPGGLFVGLAPDRAVITGAQCADSPAHSGESCWFLTVQDAPANRGLAAGFVTQAAADTRIQHVFDPATAPREPQGERLGFSSFRANCLYAPSRRVASGDGFKSETFALIPAWGAVHTELDELARMAAVHSKSAPLKKPLLAVQVSGDDMDMRAADLAAAPWPPDIVFLDPALDSPRLPGAALSASHALRAHGISTGLVWRPFHIASDSQIAKKHPAWLLDNPGPSLALLDISRPDVQEYIKVTATRIVVEWGFSALVLEDTQAVFSASGFTHKGVSRHELYRSVLSRLRTAAGPDAVIILRGAPPLLAAGVAHALLPEPDDGIFAHYAHGRLWALESAPEPCSGADCADTGGQLARAALSSGVLTLSADQITRMPVWGDTPLGALMIYPAAFRGPAPGLGVIKSEIPERPWALLSADAAPQDLCRAAGYANAEACRGFDVLQGVYSDGKARDSGRVLFMARPGAPVPQLLYSNTGPAALGRDVSSDYWDAQALALNGAMFVRKGRNHHLVFYAPPQFKLTNRIFESADVNPADVDVYRQGSILHVRFKPAADGVFKWTLSFSDEDAAPDQGVESPDQ